jgi:protein O-mannosyl-transferase
MIPPSIAAMTAAENPAPPPRAATPSAPAGSAPPRPWLAGLLLFALALAVYWPAAGYPFINMDDDLYVTANAHVLGGLSSTNLAWAFGGLKAGFWHPLTWLSLQLDATLWGPGPGGFHRTNLLLHAANTVWVFLFLRRLTGSLGRSTLVAALFAVHPLRVEAVAWVSERKELLGAFFGLLSLYFYARYAQKRTRVPRPSPLDYGLSLGCFALGLMSKPMVVTLPLVMLLLDRWPLRRIANARVSPANLRVLVEKIPFLALGAVAAWLTMKSTFHVTGMDGNAVVMFQHPLALRLQNAAVSCLVYLFQTVWPFKLAALYPYPNAYPAAAIAGAVALLGLLTVVAGRLGRWWALGWSWYLITLLPVIGLIQVGPHAHADRYAYLPLIGIFTALVWELAEHWPPRGKIFGVAAAALLLAAGTARTRDQLAHWQDSGNLFAHTSAVTRTNFIAEALLGNYLAGQNRPAEAADHFQRAVDWRPDYADAWNGLGLARRAQGRGDEAQAAFRRALAANPGHVGAWNNLGLALMAAGRDDDAMDCYRHALQFNPAEAAALNNLGQALMARGKFAEAIPYFERAVQARPEEAGFHVNLASALGHAGRINEAVAQYRLALNLNPGLDEVRKFLQAADAPAR